MASQVLGGTVTGDPQIVADGSFMLNDGGSGERTGYKSVLMGFATITQTTPQIYINADPATPLDVPYTATSPYPVLRARNVPAFRRLRLMELEVAVLGTTSWAGGTGIALQDSYAQGVFAYYPLTALTAMTVNALPMTQKLATLQATVSSYNAATGAITFAGGTLITTTLANLPFRVIAGTGSGVAPTSTGGTTVSGIVASNTATVLTPNALPQVALDTTSVVEFPYWVATSSSGTTVAASNGTFVANVLAAGGYYVYIVAGTGIGQCRLITGNTSTTLTVPTWTTNPDTTSIFMVTTNPNGLGVYDAGLRLSVAAYPINIQQGSGLSIGIYGSMSAGSNLRVRGWGYA